MDNNSNNFVANGEEEDSAAAVVAVAMMEEEEETTAAAAAEAVASKANVDDDNDHLDNVVKMNVVNIISSSNKKPRLDDVDITVDEIGADASIQIQIQIQQQIQQQQQQEEEEEERRRLNTIQKWIAQPIDKLRDQETGIFYDPYPALIKIKIKGGGGGGGVNGKETKKDEHEYNDTGVLIGNKYHASDVSNLLKLGVTAVLNCASGGIARLPVDELKSNGIIYGFTNVRQDDLKYPILHDLLLPSPQQVGITKPREGDDNSDNTTADNKLMPLIASQHLKVAKTMYIEEVLKKKGKILFFCVAGQNRSATLALSVLLLQGKYNLDSLCKSMSEVRPFILENYGFQKQLIQLEYYLNKGNKMKKRYGNGKGMTMYAHGDYTEEDAAIAANKGNMIMASMSYDTACDSAASSTMMPRSSSQQSLASSFTGTTTPINELLISTAGTATNVGSIDTSTTREYVEIELLIPGLMAMEAIVPVPSSISEVKTILVDYANTYLLKSEQREVAKSWMVLATFGEDSMYDLPLEEEAIEKSVQINRLEQMFHLKTAEAAAAVVPVVAAAAAEAEAEAAVSSSVPSHKPVGMEGSKNNNNDRIVYWTSKCRFALVIFSVYTGSVDEDEDNDNDNNDDENNKNHRRRYQEPWTFQHQERPGAPATLLENTLISTRLRGWDFCDGQAYASKEPIVFSFSPDGASDKRQFMKISTCSQQSQQFEAPGEGGILGMGANAIVHRVELQSTSPKSFASITTSTIDTTTNTEEKEEQKGKEEEEEQQLFWDAAVKRPFSLSKMLSSLKSSSEAGLAKRLRLLAHSSLLNSDGRVLYFYGLGVALSSNAYQPTEYKFEACILARYEEEFATYTMKKFMIDYTTITTPSPITTTVSSSSRDNNDNDGETTSANGNDWRKDFSLISVKILLVSLLNAFRDLTLMGVQAFDFNHLGNVLVSRDHQSVKLLDIDGDSRGSIKLSEYMMKNNNSDNEGGGGGGGVHNSSNKTKTTMSSRRPSIVLHKPSLDIDLNAVLPTVVQQLLLGKGRGTGFVANTKSLIWRLPPIEAKELIGKTVNENFGPLTDSHMAKVVEWFYAMLKKQPPWGNWTHDIYDAMRCIDHLPIR